MAFGYPQMLPSKYVVTLIMTRYFLIQITIAYGQTSPLSMHSGTRCQQSLNPPLDGYIVRTHTLWLIISGYIVNTSTNQTFLQKSSTLKNPSNIFFWNTKNNYTRNTMHLGAKGSSYSGEEMQKVPKRTGGLLPPTPIN
jgi:hypothetical protein